MKEKILAHWNSISKREQQGIIVTGIVVMFTAFYLGLINPVVSRANNAKQTLEKERELAIWVGKKVSQIKALQAEGAGGETAGFSSMPLSQAVTTSVSGFNLQIIRLQPQQNDLQVWLQPMTFNNLLRWLDELEKRYSIVVKAIEIDKGNAPGNIEIKRLQLGRS